MADGLAEKPEPLSFEGIVALNWKPPRKVEKFIAAAHGEKDDKTKAYSTFSGIWP